MYEDSIYQFMLIILQRRPPMKEISRTKKMAALLIALIFTMVTVLGSASVPTYAASSPAKVKGVKVTAKSASVIQIKWKKAKGAKKYQIYRATSKNGKYKKIKTTTKKSYVNKKLKSGKKYYYKIRGINGKKKGKFSSIKYAKTKKGTALSDVVVNTAAKTVTIKASVNGTYFTKSTRHLMIDRKGFNKGLAILDSYCYPEDLYNGLVKAGGVSWSSSKDKTLKNGEKISKGNAENKNYSTMSVTISWEGESHDLSECLTTTRGGSSAPKLNMVFSGNPKAAAKTYSGCMVCLDSCYIGIVSNSEYGLCDIDNGKPTVFARSDVLPDDGTVVDVTFKLK